MHWKHPFGLRLNEALTQQRDLLSLHRAQWRMHMQRMQPPTHHAQTHKTEEQMHRYLIRTDGSCCCLLPRCREDKRLKNACRSAQATKTGSDICLSPGEIWNVSVFWLYSHTCRQHRAALKKARVSTSYCTVEVSSLCQERLCKWKNMNIILLYINFTCI